jgi:Ca2+-transporting ATPase
LFNLPIMLAPVHVAFLELLISPTCSMVFEAEPPAKDLMQRAPRAANAPLVSRAMLLQSLWQGGIIFLIVLALFAAQLVYGIPTDAARASSFALLVVCNIALVWYHLSHANPWLWRMTAIALFLLGSVLSVPLLRDWFHFALW